MNRDQFQGAWKQISGQVKEKWGKLTDDEITQINGKREALLGLIQQKYGYAKERAEEEISRFENNLHLGHDKGSWAHADKAHSQDKNPSHDKSNLNRNNEKNPNNNRQPTRR